MVYVPLDLPGVSRGKPLEKLGQRTYKQAEVICEDAAVPRDLLVVEPEDYKGDCYSIFAVAVAAMGAIFTGCARAAYELAFDYAHDRKQGGATILQHQSVEKILRDARASMIEDDRNEVLAIRGGGMLVNPELI